MFFDKQTHLDFLETELRAQTDNFKKKLDTPATYMLLQSGEVFVAQYMKLSGGDMILKFSDSRTLPRKGDFLHCMLMPKELRNYRNWRSMSYGDLVAKGVLHTEAVCNWYGKSSDDRYSIAGFRGVEATFAKIVEKAQGVILVLGPHEPPFRYIMNLMDVVHLTKEEDESILYGNYEPHKWSPILLDNKKSVSAFITKQLDLTPTIILQGPPGTGKTYMIAELCSELCARGNSVLVAALTNRALMETATKEPLAMMLKDHKIRKTNLSFYESHELPDLELAEECAPLNGHLLLSTFYVASGAGKTSFPLFDYVIVDEASQAILAMFEATRRLGRRNLLIGDVRQLPPVVEINEDKINRRKWSFLVDGFKTLTESSITPIYQLTESYRLTMRAAEFTKIFYSGNYFAREGISGIEPGDFECARFLHRSGGPTLIKTDMPAGELAPDALLLIVSNFVASIYNKSKKINVAVLSCFIETVKKMQAIITQTSGNHENLIVETVARVQGLTTDITIFVIPESAVLRSLELRLFNVATSRAKSQTIIITDKNILQHRMPDEVRKYLEKLDDDFSFYIPFNKNMQLLQS